MRIFTRNSCGNGHLSNTRRQHNVQFIFRKQSSPQYGTDGYSLKGREKKKWKFYPLPPDFRNSMAFRKVPRLCPFLLLIQAACRWRQLRGIVGMTLTGENRSKTRLSATLANHNLTWTDMGSNRCLRGEKAETIRQSHDTALKTTKTGLKYTSRFGSCSAVNTTRLS
jgi:hypothetical protein